MDNTCATAGTIAAQRHVDDFTRQLLPRGERRRGDDCIGDQQPRHTDRLLGSAFHLPLGDWKSRSSGLSWWPVATKQTAVPYCALRRTYGAAAFAFYKYL